jgi:hypothetical protein
VIGQRRDATIRDVKLRSALLPAVAALLFTAPLAVAPATAAASDLPIRQSDPVGDVNIFDGGGTKPTTGQRRTIDLERFVVKRRGDGVRFIFRIARIAAGRTFDQVVEAQLHQPGRDGFVLDVLANPQHKNGTAYSDDAVCLADVRTARRTGTVRVDVPGGCVPEGSGVLRATTYLQEKNGSGPGFSEDVLRVSGRVALR